MDNMNKDNYDVVQDEANVQRYRQRRVDGFKLNISDSSDFTEEISSDSANAAPSEDTSNDITSFSDETTRARIERDSKKELRRQRKEEKKIERIKSGRNKKIYRFAWLSMLIILCVVAAQYLIVGCNDFLAITRKDKTTATVRVEAGDDMGDIARKLEKENIINDSSFFALFAAVTSQDEPIEPGIYQIPKNLDYLGVINYLQYTDNRKITITVQITEGTNILDLADVLYEAGVTYDKDEFLELCNSTRFDEDFPFLKDIEDNDERVYRLEGYLFPDTYEFYMHESPEITINRLLTNFENKVYETEYTVEGYKEPVTLIDLVNESGFTLDEVVNLASLVQAEAADTEDMYKVSSVINNRLSYGSQSDIHSLGLDCTAFYPYKNKDKVPEDIRDTFHSDYETYETKGLPPGAVCNAGADALLAAVVPADTDYLYFCHGTSEDGTVTPYYAVTFSEHQNNMAQAGLS